MHAAAILTFDCQILYNLEATQSFLNIDTLLIDIRDFLVSYVNFIGNKLKRVKL